MKTLKGDLILKKDTTFDESIKVEGDIKGYYNLKVIGNIKARDIDARDIKAWDIDALNIDARDIKAWDIDARDIDAEDIYARNIKARDIDALNINAWDIKAWDIDARDIDAEDIICEKRIKKYKNNKTLCRVFVEEKSKLEFKERCLTEDLK